MKSLINILKSRSFYIPSLIILLFVVAVFVFSGLEPQKYYQLDRIMSQWDGQHYLSIAQNGYQIEVCHPSLPDNQICGNVGWFPFYPLIGKLSGWLPFKMSYILLSISLLLFWMASLLLFSMVKKEFTETTAIVTLLAMLAFPTSFYFLTIFPYSLFLFLSISIFYLLNKDNFNYLFLLTAALAVTYPSGIIIGLPILYLLIKHWKEYSRKQKLQLSASLISIGAALLLFALYYWVEFDDFFLYNHFQAQSYFDHKISFAPLVFFDNIIVDFNRLVSDFNLLSSSGVGSYEIGLRYVPVWIISALVLVFVPILYQKKIKISWQIFLLGILLFTPTFGTMDCYYRHIIVGFPLFLMVGLSWNGFRKYFVLLYFLISIVLGWFFYLPLFKLSHLM